MESYTPEEMAKMFGTPQTSAGSLATQTSFSPEEMAEMFKTPKGGGEAQPVTHRKFYDALASTTPDENQPYGKVGKFMSDAAVGTAKSLIGIPIHLAQFVAHDILGNKGNNALNPESAQGQYVNESLKGNTTAQKVGKTFGDVASLFMPGGAVAKAGEVTSGFAKTVPLISKYASQVGTAGKVARFAPRAAGAVVESGIATPALTGHQMGKEDWGISLLAPFITPVIKSTGRLFRATTKSGREMLANEAAEKLARDLESGDPTALGKYLQGSEKFSKQIRSRFEANPNITANRALNRADDKVSNITDKDVFDNIYDNGKIDGVYDDGRFRTTLAQERQTEIIKKNAGLADRLFGSSNAKTKPLSFVTSLLDDYDNAAGAVPTNKVRAIQNFLEGNPALQKTEITPKKLFNISKDLRDMAYKADLAQTPVDTDAAQAYRDLARKIDDYLYKGLPDVDKVALNKLRQNQTLAYSTRSVLQAMEKVKTGAGKFGRTLSGGAGAVLGYGQGGFFGGVAGKAIGEKAYNAVLKAFSDKNLASGVLERFAQVANAKEIKALQDIVESNITKNQSAAYRAKMIREYVERIAKKAAGAKKFEEFGNVGSKYPQKLPNINAGPRPVPRPSAFPTAEGAPNVYSPKITDYYTPSDKLPTIDFGEPGVSKYKKPIRGFPTIQ